MGESKINQFYSKKLNIYSVLFDASKFYGPGLLLKVFTDKKMMLIIPAH